MGKRSILAAGIAGLILGSGWLTWWVKQDMSTGKTVPEIILADETGRDAFLREIGLSDCRCIAEESVRLPAEVDAAYENYAALQKTQKLPLTSHLGETASRYTYTQNSSGQESLYTELLVGENQVLIGAVQYDPADQVMQPVISESFFRG